MNELAENPIIAWGYLVTHAEKREKTILGFLFGWLLTRWQWTWKYLYVRNPGMSWTGKRKVRALRSVLNGITPYGPSAIHRGSGQRQKDVADCLGCGEYAVPSDVWGGPQTLIKIAGKKYVITAEGKFLKYGEEYKITPEMGEAIRNAILELPQIFLICSGRPVLVRLGMSTDDPNCQSGAIFKICVHRDKTISIKLIHSGIILKDIRDGGARV